MQCFRNHSETIQENPPKLDSGTIPEPFRKNYQNPFPDTLRNRYGYSQSLDGDAFPTHITHGKEGYAK